MAADWRYEFSAVKSDKGLVFASRPYFDRVVSTLGDGEEVVVTVAKPQNKRSIQANRALWGPMYDSLMDGIAAEVGIDRGDKKAKELMHEGLLERFAGTVLEPVTKREVAKERSSSMTVARFSEFMEFVARFAADEYGVVVALPGEM